MQSFDCNTLIFNNIRFCIFVKPCKNTQKSLKKGDFSGKTKPFEAQNPTFRVGFCASKDLFLPLKTPFWGLFGGVFTGFYKNAKSYIVEY